MYRKLGALMAVAAASVFAAAASAQTVDAQDAINPADFTNEITNPYFPISSFRTLSYEGEEEDPDTGETIETSGRWTVMTEKKTASGVEVLVVKDEAFEDGELVESTLDYFAQHRDGTVYYFGEDVDNYEDGVLANHDGSWLAGEGGSLPGVFMPASPKAGDSFEQERAPGIAEDHSEVVDEGVSVTVPAGSFSNCIMTEDINPLDNPVHVENKFYCPEVGLVKETAEGVVFELAGFTRAPAVTATATRMPATAVAPAPTLAAGGAHGVTPPATGTGGSGASSNTLWLAAALIALGGIGVAVCGTVNRRS